MATSADPAARGFDHLRERSIGLPQVGDGQLEVLDLVLRGDELHAGARIREVMAVARDRVRRLLVVHGFQVPGVKLRCKGALSERYKYSPIRFGSTQPTNIGTTGSAARQKL